MACVGAGCENGSPFPSAQLAALKFLLRTCGVTSTPALDPLSKINLMSKYVVLDDKVTPYGGVSVAPLQPRSACYRSDICWHHRLSHLRHGVGFFFFCSTSVSRFGIRWHWGENLQSWLEGG